MNRCFSLAMRGRPSPNPFVGAILVHNQRVIGEGFHEAAGRRHAEVEAIRQVRRKFGAMAPYFLRASTLYVNLEPCNHYGKQPPCTQAVLRAGIPRVVYALKDPNPKAAGGAETLRKTGIRVRLAGPQIQSKALALNAPFLHHIRTGRAYVTLKMAISKDKQIRTGSKKSPYLSSPESLRWVHFMRNKCPAIMVGIGTVRADNPRLTCRMAGGHDPLRVIIDPHLQIDEKARVLGDKNVLIVCSRKMDRQKASRLKKKGISLFFAPERGGRPNLKPLLTHLASLGMDHVLLEGGPRLAAGLLRMGRVDETVIFRSPKKAGRKIGEENEEMTRAANTVLSRSRPGHSVRCGPDRVEFSRIRKGKKECFWPGFFEKK